MRRRACLSERYSEMKHDNDKGDHEDVISVPPFIIRARSIAHDFADKVIKFCELLALTAAFQFVHVKTNNYTIGMILGLLQIIVVFYVIEAIIYMLRDNFPKGRRSWKKMCFLVGFLAFVGFVIYGRSRDMFQAVTLMATNH